MFLYSNELQVGNFQVEKFINVWRPQLKSLPLNCYMSQNKIFTRNLETIEKLSCTNLKFDLKLVTLAKNSLWHTWNLKLSTNRSTLLHTLSQTSTAWKTFFHTWELTTFWRSFFHTSHSLEKLQAPCMPPLGNELPPFCKLKNLLSKGFSPFFYAIQAQNPSLLWVLTQCPFSCLVWAHNLLETTWKQARNESFKVHEVEQLY